MNTVSDIGEFGLIEMIKNMDKRDSGVYGIGDDCAIIPFNKEKELVVTTDTLVEGIHFFKGTNAYLLGRKSLSVNVSDIAAMAALPKWAFLSISVNEDMELDYMESFMKGFFSAADKFGIFLLGGDTTKGPLFYITVTLIGENDISKSIKRSTANIGDDVYVTGEIGCSYAGFTAIKQNLDGFYDIKQKHLNPAPRLNEALSVKKFAAAMIDISDGLVQDCAHICSLSGVAMRLDFNKIPFCKTELIGKEDMLSGGEDYELVFTADKEYRTIIDNMENITRIGEVVEGFGVIVTKDKRELNIKNAGFKHF